MSILVMVVMLNVMVTNVDISDGGDVDDVESDGDKY